MTTEDYRRILEEEIRVLNEIVSEDVYGTVAGALLLCERNRLVDRLYELSRRTAPAAVKIKGKIVPLSDFSH